MARENDVVLIYIEDSPVTFARVESIEPDIKRDWYNISLLMLQVPLNDIVIWTLKDLYINGEEFFMGGKRMRIEVVKSPQGTAEHDYSKGRDDETRAPLQQQETPGKIGGNVISFADALSRRQKT